MKNKINFFATVVRCYTENEVSVIGFGDHDETPKNFVIITRFDEDPDEPSSDESIGIQTHLSSHEIAGAVSQVNFSSRSLEIAIADTAADDVGASILQVEFEPEHTDIGILKNYLHQIFDRSSVSISISK